VLFFQKPSYQGFINLNFRGGPQHPTNLQRGITGLSRGFRDTNVEISAVGRLVT
jgi:hypothetical protein